MGRYGLRTGQWERIARLLPGKEGDVGVTARDNKLFVDAVLYRFRAGIPWRDLPERFGEPINVHKRFSRWAKTGVWERVFAHLAATAPSCALINTWFGYPLDWSRRGVGPGSYGPSWHALLD